MKHKLPFNKVYQTKNYYPHSIHFVEMSTDQVVETEQFIDRFLVGLDTRGRLAENRREHARTH
nr:hypothetical protein [uncultured Duganella sp.]